MSQTPPPIPHDPMLGYYTPPMVFAPHLRGAPRGFAITAIVFGCLQLFSLISLVLLIAGMMPSNSAINALERTKWYRPYMFGMTVMQILLGAGLLYGGIQSLKLRERGRRILMTTALLDAVIIFIGIPVSLFYVIPLYYKVAAQNPNDPAARMVATFSWFGILISVVWVVMFAIMAYVMNRPKTIEQFQQTRSI